MEIKKIVETLKGLVYRKALESSSEKQAKYIKNLTLAIESLEKEVPKRPLRISLEDNKIVTFCPECPEQIETWETECPVCGQEIEWRDRPGFGEEIKESQDKILVTPWTPSAEDRKEIERPILLRNERSGKMTSFCPRCLEKVGEWDIQCPECKQELEWPERAKTSKVEEYFNESDALSDEDFEKYMNRLGVTEKMEKTKIENIDDLVEEYKRVNPTHHYFDERTLEFFGEDIENMEFLGTDRITYYGKPIEVYVISRLQKNHPKGPRRTQAYFAVDTLIDITPDEEA